MPIVGRNICQLFIKKLLKKDAYSALYHEKPLSVLVLPPINRSVKVEAKEAFYSSLSAPIAQMGYYTLPPLLAMDILKEESAYDSELFFGQSTKKWEKYLVRMPFCSQ